MDDFVRSDTIWIMQCATPGAIDVDKLDACSTSVVTGHWVDPDEISHKPHRLYGELTWTEMLRLA
ncbi:hypothetical protein N7454_001460 [Penicillium verhagenii]|nr:hypothetical protein N7454_001460 [Penicillium verhagenii]